jgi:hypothetical protein
METSFQKSPDPGAGLRVEKESAGKALRAARRGEKIRQGVSREVGREWNCISVYK